MAKSGYAEADDFDLLDSDDELGYIDKLCDKYRTRKARQKLDRRMEMKRLRDMLDGYDVDDWD
ncbi:MAG: hypothetical protein OQK78_07615 [Gammaproteobacteria bacterium]|nr:hypothetical protein [Gammaproteobacteria bacterium]MCW8887469.1 hypothetical protein [Gammaproteobacteria bacterium]